MQEVRGGSKSLQEVTRDYKRLQRGYKRLQKVTRDYKRLQGVTRA